MQKKVIGILVCTLLVTLIFFPVSNAGLIIKKQSIQESSFENSIIGNSGISLITIKVEGEMGLNNWYVSDVFFNFTYESDEIAEIFYWIDGGFWWTYTEPFYIEDDGEDISLEWCAVDHEGNKSDADGPFFCSIDQTDPDIYLTYEVTGGDPVHGWEFTFTAEATDDMSDMDKVEFYFNNELQYTAEEPDEGTNDQYSWSLLYFPIPHAVFGAKAYDNAGNSHWDEIRNSNALMGPSLLYPDIEQESTIKCFFDDVSSSDIVEKENGRGNEKLPSSNPGGNVFDPAYVIVVFNRKKMGENGWLADNVSIPIFYESDRVDEVYYQINAGEWMQYSESLVFSDGIYVFSWYIVDSEGFTSTPESMSFKIDQTLPEINLIRERLAIGKIKFTANVYDATSGINKVKFYDNYPSSKPKFVDYDFPYEWIWAANDWRDWIFGDTVTAIVFDNAGNGNICWMSTLSSSPYFSQESSQGGLL